MSSAVTFSDEPDNEYHTVVLISSNCEQQQQQQPPCRPLRGIMTDGRFKKNKPVPSTRSSIRSSFWSSRRQQQLEQQKQQQQQQQQQQQKQRKYTKKQSIASQSSVTISRRSASSRRSGASTVEVRRQLTIISTLSCAVFMINLLAVTAILAIYSNHFFHSEAASDLDAWLSLSIGTAKSCSDRGSNCHNEKTLSVNNGSAIGPLVCSSWSKNSAHCKQDIGSPIFKLLNGHSEHQIGVLKNGYYRISMMVTFRSQSTQFEILVNNDVWAQCYGRSIAKKSGVSTYSRCFTTAVRYLRANEDKVQFRCISSTSCQINSFEKVTHFGLELVNRPPM